MADAPARRQRLSRSADFERVYRHGRSTQHRLVVVYRFDRPDDIHGEIGEGAGCRVGITVSKKLGGAVERNRLKRQLWEAIDRCGVLPEGYDLVVIARPGLPDAIASNGFDWLVELVAEQVEKLISNDGKQSGPDKSGSGKS